MKLFDHYRIKLTLILVYLHVWKPFVVLPAAFEFQAKQNHFLLSILILIKVGT